jgi:hypothetical protein
MVAAAAAIESNPEQLKSVRDDIKELLRMVRGSPDVLPITNACAMCLRASDSVIPGFYAKINYSPYA